jgi:hypothetical protein
VNRFEPLDCYTDPSSDLVASRHRPRESRDPAWRSQLFFREPNGEASREGTYWSLHYRYLNTYHSGRKRCFSDLRYFPRPHKQTGGSDDSTSHFCRDELRTGFANFVFDAGGGHTFDIVG